MILEVLEMMMEMMMVMMMPMILFLMVIMMGMMLLMQACEYRVHYFEHPCQNSLKHLKLPKYFMLLNVFEASKIFYVLECILSFSFF